MKGEVVSFDGARDVGFSSAQGKAAARAKAEAARAAREERKLGVETYLATKVGRAMNLLASQVDAAWDEQDAADKWNVTVEDAELDGLERRVPDKDVMARGLRAAETVLERTVGKVASKVEGEITHSHVFELLADARRARGGG